MAAGSARGVRGLVGAALDLVLPRPCPGCGRPGPWCPDCAATLAGRPRAVRLPDAMLDTIGKPAAGALLDTTSSAMGETRGNTMGEASHGVSVPPVFALSRYRGPPRAAIIAGKERNRRDLPPVLGAALGAGLGRLLRAGVIAPPGASGLWLVPAPSRRAAARARGGDPVTSMAAAAARTLAAAGLPTGVAPCLRTAGGVDSVGLDAAERIANLAGRVRFRPAGAPPIGSGVVLLDDVLTTGATVATALRVLASEQVRVSAVLVVASVARWRSAHG